LLEITRECKSLNGPPQIFVETDDFGEAAFALCEMHAYETGRVIGLCKIERRGEPIPAIEESAQAARTKINGGGVKLLRSAFERKMVHRSANTNHFLSQVLTYRPEARDTPVELVAALTTAVNLFEG
jgi:hypothetical protein